MLGGVFLLPSYGFALHQLHKTVILNSLQVNLKEESFADPALLGGKGDIKGCFLVFHIASVHYWLIDLFIAFNHSFHIAILKDCFISILFSCFHSFLKY